jgi:ABC-type branched-subunit amino acid transport system substrate-binding protein
VKRLFRWAASFALVSSVTCAAWATAGTARGTVQRAATQPLRVAIVIPKSGAFSIHNRLLANGATVAVDEINAERAGKGQAPVRLKLRVVPVGSKESAKGIVRSLVHSSARVLILPCNVELQESLAQAAAKAGLLTLSPCNPDPKLATTLARYWPVGASGAAEAAQLVFYAKYRYKLLSRVFLLGTPQSWYSSEMLGELRAYAKRNKLKVVGQASVPLGSRGLAGLANKIRKANPGMVFAAVPSPTIESIISSLRQRQVTSPFFVTDGMDASINFLRYRDGPDSSSLEDVVFATFGFPRTSSAQFSREYGAAYGKQPLGSFPGLGYETLHVLETAAQRAATPTPAGLNAAFAKGFTAKGVALEDITYPGHGHRQPVNSVGLAEVIRDAYVALLTSVAGHPVG